MEISTKLFVGSPRYTERRYLIGREEAHPLASSPRSRTPAREIPEDRFERARLRAVSGIGPLNALIPSPSPCSSEKKTSLSFSLSPYFSSPNSRPRNSLFRPGKPLYLTSSFSQPKIEDPSRSVRDRRFIIWPAFGRPSVGTRDPTNASPRSTGLPDKSKG